MSTLRADQEPTKLIIGAGAAGLSLLLALDDVNYPFKVTILERNSAPQNDRIWSFWRLNTTGNELTQPCVPPYIASIIIQEWPCWHLSTAQSSFVMHDSNYRYCSLRSEDLSSLAAQKIRQNPRFNIIYNCDVSTIDVRNNICLLHSNKGEFSADKVLDTRPTPIEQNHKGLLQCFYGEEIKVSHGIFDASCVELMQQLAYSELGLEFVYILPFDAKHALVEFTCFSVKPISQEVLKLRLHAVISKLVREYDHSVQRTENAILPMYLVNKNRAKQVESIHYAGIAGGAMRASTGYSFLNSQAWATQCAQSLMRNNTFYTAPGVKPIYNLMDTIMLNVLRQDMSIGVSIFERMFKNVKPARFVRFMTQHATIVDFISVIWAMPKMPFLSAACKLLLNTK